MDILLLYIDRFGPELLAILVGSLVILFSIFMWLWMVNKRRYNNLQHAIPANVIKSYLDSIIQNSTSLKSQLFRGDSGGQIPSVLPLGDLVSAGSQLGLSGQTQLIEDLNKAKARISELELQLKSRPQSGETISSIDRGQSQEILELQKRNEDLTLKLAKANERIKELEELLKKAQSQSQSSESSLVVDQIMKERDELNQKLKEYEIIADDLANLKRLKQENEQLKKALEGGGQSLTPGTQEILKSSPPVEETNLEESLGDFLSENKESESSLEAKPVAPEATPVSKTKTEAASDDKPKSEKTPDDLLSEFEKMLG